MILAESFNEITNYVSLVHNKMMAMALIDKYRPQNILDFMSQTTHSELLAHIKRVYGINILDDISASKTFVANTKSSIFISNSLPIEDAATKYSLFKVHKFPTIKDGIMANPYSEASHMAVSLKGNKYIPLSLEEAEICYKKGRKLQGIYR